MSDNLLLATLVHDAMRFAIWAAGQGIMPDEGEPARGPEDFLYEYSCAMDIDDWEGLAEVARDALMPVAAQSVSMREALEAIQSEIVLSGHLAELVDAALAAQDAKHD